MWIINYLSHSGRHELVRPSKAGKPLEVFRIWAGKAKTPQDLIR